MGTTSLMCLRVREGPLDGCQVYISYSRERKDLVLRNRQINPTL